jgi:hypothetical protein
MLVVFPIVVRQEREGASRCRQTLDQVADLGDARLVVVQRVVRDAADLGVR